MSMKIGRRWMGLALALTAGSLWADSFTLDFRYPRGAGSPYPDAISLKTDGAALDRNGRPIGFVRINLGDADADRRVAAVELTVSGLVFNTTADNFMLGIPFDTRGVGQDSGGTNRLIAVLTDVQGMDRSWEQLAVGWGFTNTVGGWTNFSGARIMADSGILYESRSGANYRRDTGSIPDQTVTVRKWSNTGLKFYAQFDTGGTSISDVFNLINTASNVYGLFGAHNTAGGDGFSGCLVAIRFAGEYLVIPPPSPEGGSVFIIW